LIGQRVTFTRYSITLTRLMCYKSMILTILIILILKRYAHSQSWKLQQIW